MSGGAEIVNPVPVDEAEGWLRSFFATLQMNPFGENFDNVVWRRRAMWDAARTWGVRDRGRWVGSLGTLARTLTVPAGATGTVDVDADALTAVSVAATHRRQGLLTGMLAQSLAAARERGDAVSMLIAAEWPIYGRFGYAPATDAATYLLHPRAAGPVRGAVPGRVRWSDPAEICAVGPAVYERARRRHAGEVSRPPGWWERMLGQDGRPPRDGIEFSWVIHEAADGTPDGLVGWRAERPFDLTSLGEISVGTMITASDQAYLDLWAYVAGIDGVEQVRLHERAVDEPVRRLIGNGRALATSAVHDMLWVRLLDVPAALSARGYAADGEVVLDVLDNEGGWAAGRYALVVHGGAGECTPTERPADLRVQHRALASRYLGDHPLTALAQAGDVEELTRGALARTDGMFATLQRPWTQTPF